jgi:hypothetical protein
VTSEPIGIFTSASTISSACASVFTAMNSQPAEAGVDHPVDGVRAATADADDLDQRQVVPALITYAQPVSTSTFAGHFASALGRVRLQDAAVNAV